MKRNAYMIEHLSDYMSRVKGELKHISKHASMVTVGVKTGGSRVGGPELCV